MMCAEQPVAVSESTAPRALVAAYGFPPLAGPTEYRWLRFVCHLAEAGWEIDVLTTRPLSWYPWYDQGLLDLIPCRVNVIRAFPGIYQSSVVRRRWERVQARKLRGPDLVGTLTEGRDTDYRDRMARLLGRLDIRLSVAWKIPDEAIGWVPYALWEARRLVRAHRYSVVASSSTPFSSHLVGWAASRWASVPWVGDLSDPYALSPIGQRPRWRRSLDRLIEQACLTNMEAVVVPTERMKLDYLYYYPRLDLEKVHVIPYGFAEELFTSVQPERSPKFRVVHTGHFYPDIRDPRPFFDALTQVRDLESLEVLLVGDLPDQYLRYLAQAGLTEVVHHIGFQPRERVTALQMGAAILMLLGNRGGVQLPGKVFDYIASRRPILMIKNDVDDLAADIIRSAGNGVIVYNRPDQIAAALRDLYAVWQQRKLDERFNLVNVTEYSWTSRARAMEDLLRKCLPVYCRDPVVS